MAIQKYNSPSLRHTKEGGKNIIEFKFSPKNLDEGKSLLKEYLQVLGKLKHGEKARVLIDLNSSVHDPRQALIWKSNIEFFEQHIERSAIIGATPITGSVIQGMRFSAAFSGVPVDQKRLVVFENRDEALSWLTN
jgi:hypothetical protein